LSQFGSLGTKMERDLFVRVWLTKETKFRGLRPSVKTTDSARNCIRKEHSLFYRSFLSLRVGPGWVNLQKTNNASTKPVSWKEKGNWIDRNALLSRASARKEKTCLSRLESSGETQQMDAFDRLQSTTGTIFLWNR
jgi:hypothetical protein